MQILPFPALPLQPEPADFRRKAAHLALMLSLVEDCLVNALEDVARSAPDEIDLAERLREVKAHIFDLNSDVVGTLEGCAERTEAALYDGCPRGPFHRRRRSA